MEAPPPAYVGDPNAVQEPYQSYGNKEAKDDRFHYDTRPECNDVLWLVLFVSHLVLMLILAGIYGPDLVKRAKEAESSSSSRENNPDLEKHLGQVIGILVVAALAGAGTAAAWMAFAKRYADGIIKLSLGLSVAINVLFFFGALAAGAGFAAIMFLFFAGLTALYFYLVRNRIRFAGVMLELSVNVIQAYTAPVYVAFLFVFLEFAWVLFWAFTFLSVYDAIQGSSAAAFLLLISFYWTAEVLKNIVHVTTAGVAATWWFFAEPRSPTSASFKRATTTSLGSICFGSLLVAILSAIKAMLDAASRNEESSLAQECVRCIVSCLEDLMKYFNVYAFSRIAIYGSSFWTAGKETFDLFKSRGFDVIINDDLTGTVLAIGAFVGFAIAGGISLAWASQIGIGDTAITIGIVGGLIGYAMVYLVMNVLRSCVATFFITWAEEPQALQQSRPEMYVKLSDAVRRMYPNLHSGF